MAVGDHLAVRTDVVWHHGIDVGDGSVIHFTGPGGSRKTVTTTSVDDFDEGQTVYLIVYESPAYTGTAVVERSRSLIGRGDYNLLSNNCEHIARWCVLGEAASLQVDKVNFGANHGARFGFKFARSGFLLGGGLGGALAGPVGAAIAGVVVGAVAGVAAAFTGNAATDPGPVVVRGDGRCPACNAPRGKQRKLVTHFRCEKCGREHPLLYGKASKRRVGVLSRTSGPKRPTPLGAKRSAEAGRRPGERRPRGATKVRT